MGRDCRDSPIERTNEEDTLRIDRKRRRISSLTGLIGLIGLSGCLSSAVGEKGGEESTASSPPTTNTPSSTSPTPAGTSTVSEEYSEYKMVSDDSRTVLVEIPVEWTEVNPSRFNVGPGLSAAPDLEGFTNGYSVPGMFIYATNQMQDSSPDEILDQTIPENYFTDCVNQGRGDFNSREDYSGRFQQLTNCNDAGTIVPIAAIPTDRSFVVRMEIQLVEPRDQEALARIVQSFEVNGPI